MIGHFEKKRKPVDFVGSDGRSGPITGGELEIS